MLFFANKPVKWLIIVRCPVATANWLWNWLFISQLPLLITWLLHIFRLNWVDKMFAAVEAIAQVVTTKVIYPYSLSSIWQNLPSICSFDPSIASTPSCWNIRYKASLASPLVFIGYAHTHPKSNANTCAHLFPQHQYMLENIALLYHGLWTIWLYAPLLSISWLIPVLLEVLFKQIWQRILGLYQSLSHKWHQWHSITQMAN